VNEPIISLLHPTARVKPSEAFPRGWKDAHDAWLSRADHPERIEYILVVHESRLLEFDEQPLGRVHGWREFTAVTNRKRDCVVDQLNAAAEASEGLLLMGVMDDFYPPQHWDTLIIEALPKVAAPNVNPAWPEVIVPDFEGEYTIVCSSGTSPARDLELMIAGADTRKRYERYGYVLDSDFESMFSDNWRAFQARRDEKDGLCNVIERLDIQFEHRHPIFGKGQMDDIYQLQNRPQAYQDGAITFKRKMGSRMIAIGLPGQQFSSQWVAAWTVLYGHMMAVQNFLTMPVFLYTSNVHCTRMEFASTVLEARHKPDYVLSIDDDNTLEPQQFDMLVTDLDENPDLAGVVGWCWCDPADPLGDKNQPYVASCGRQTGWDENRQENGAGLGCTMFTLADFQRAFESGKKSPYLISSDDIAPDAFWSGFPVVLMRYTTLERLGPSAFVPMVRGDVKFGFSSEDTTFFYRAHQAGLKFAVDMRVKVPHLKLRAIEVQYLPGVSRQEVLKAQGKTLGIPVRDREPLANAAD